MAAAQDEIREAGDRVVLEVHTHPKGTPEEYGKAEPSSTDKTSALKTAGNVVLGYTWEKEFETNVIGGTPSYNAVRQIGYYNSNGIIGEPVDFSKYKMTIKKINKTQ